MVCLIPGEAEASSARCSSHCRAASRPDWALPEAALWCDPEAVALALPCIVPATVQTET